MRNLLNIVKEGYYIFGLLYYATEFIKDFVLLLVN